MDLCVVLALTLVTQSYSLPAHDRQPLGPEMCRHLCRTIVGCTAPSFHPTSLLCRVTYVITMSSTNSRMSRTERQKGEERDVPDAAQCSRGSKMFYSRAGALHCETHPSSTVSTVSTVPTVAHPQDKRRVLLVPFMADYWKSQFYQTAFPSWTVMTYPVDMENVTAIGYIPSSYGLLLSVSHGGKLLSFKLERQSSQTIWENLLVRDIAVDDDRHEAYVVTAEASKRVMRITVDGTPINAFQSMEDLQLITVDSKRRVMYVSTSRKLLRCSYSGKGFTTLIQSIQTTSLSFDRSQEVIYFNNDRDVIKLYPLSGKYNVLTSLNTTPSSMISVQNTLVLSTKDGVFVLPPNSPKASDLYAVSCRFVLCAVPCIRYLC
ncbi:uncharacterized protein LOC124270102 [Haliotis rubra]|uniref:uncharacterized protein LOC124270102 n=1 Tax=Haliotis rubra TaxID=36100 RepID=UPI001EE55091|nr:uncharacterized protein LOC124270102 [Haliotis rubra]